jgi:hypothetical protein
MVPSNVDPEEERRAAERRTINRAGLLELITLNDHKHDEAHRRMRSDFRELEQRCEDAQKLLAEKIHANTSRLVELSTTPVDVTKLVATPKIIASIVGTALLVAGGMWASNGGLRSDVRDILTRMSSEQRVTDANAKLIEANNATIKVALADNTREMRDALATISKRQDLLTLQYNELNSQITRLTAQREK